MMMLITSIASWAEDPYFEVVSGSFASGNVTVIFTFPEATTVEVTGSIYLDHSDKPSGAITAYGPAVSTEGNTVTATFTYTPWAGIGETGFSFWSGAITATGYSPYSNIYEKTIPPYAEALSGSLTSGNLSVKVTFPTVSSVYSDVGYGYTVSLWNNGEQLDVKTRKSDVTVDGNTISMAYTFIPQSSDDLSSSVIKIDQYTFQFDGKWNSAMEISFKTSGDDTPDDDGGDDGDDDGDDDPVAKPYIAGAFSVGGDKQVQFTKGNLYWNGSDWAIEDNQNAVTTTWNANHVSHFFWEPTADEARVEFNARPIHDFSEHLFCDGSDAEHMISFEGKDDYYALSNDEFIYLIHSRPNSASLYKYPVTVDGVNFCLVIAPDDFSGSIADTYTLDALNEAGLVCLPPTGYRTYNWSYSETQFDSQNNFFYWSSTIDGGNKSFLCSDLSMQSEYDTRNAYAIRLVRNYAEESDPAPGCDHVMNVLTPVCTGKYSTYYACEVCGHLFADAAGETEISEADVMHSFDGVNAECAHNCGKHDPALCVHATETYHDTVAPTCTEDGMEAHWECETCGALFMNYNNGQTTSEALKIEANGHNLNSYNVCSVCGYESAYATDCDHYSLKKLGDNRTTCTQHEGYNNYYKCYNCERYLEESVSNMGEYTSLLKSEMQITPGSQLHGGHLVFRDAVPEACTQAAPNIRHWYCSYCHSKYFSYADEDGCVADNEISESYFNSMTAPAVGHKFESGSHVCSRCGFDAVYRKVTVDSQIKPGANYILVSKIGDQYYAMGKPGKDSDQKYKGSLGYDAVPVTMESDGTISVTSNAVMPLYTIGQIEEPFDNNGYTRDGIRSRVPHIAFYNPVYGMVSYGPDYSLETKNRDIVLDWTSSWAFNETEAMNMHIYNGESKFYGDKNTLYGIMTGDSYGARAIEPGVLIYHMVDWGGSVFMNRYHGMYLGKNNGQNPRFHVPGFTSFGFTSENTNFEYENIYPVYLYLLDTKKFINAESTTSANVSGPVIKDDVMSIFTKAKASYDNATNLLNLYKQNDQYGYFDGYEVDMNSYRFTTIDLSKARISDGDLTYQDIMDMKNNEFSAPNVIIVLPETSGTSAAKGMNAPMKASSSLASIPNVIINGACQTLELQDKQTMNVPTDFTAGNVSYSRSGVSSAWGTLCLPYAISSDENVQLYKLSAVDNSNAEGVMTFTPIAEAEAGQPVVFKKLDADATTLSFDKENAELTIAGFNGESTDIDRWELLGTYEQAKIKSDKDFGRYYIAQNKFWNAAAEATVPAFRAWFEYEKHSTASVKANTFTIFVEDGETTSVLNVNADGELEECTEIYDLSGKKLTAPVKGQVNIINGKKIFVK